MLAGRPDPPQPPTDHTHRRPLTSVLGVDRECCCPSGESFLETIPLNDHMARVSMEPLHLDRSGLLLYRLYVNLRRHGDLGSLPSSWRSHFIIDRMHWITYQYIILITFRSHLITDWILFTFEIYTQFIVLLKIPTFLITFDWSCPFCFQIYFVDKLINIVYRNKDHALG